MIATLMVLTLPRIETVQSQFTNVYRLWTADTLRAAVAVKTPILTTTGAATIGGAATIATELILTAQADTAGMSAGAIFVCGDTIWFKGSDGGMHAVYP